jgi:CRISPR-associated protein (TIGR02584 family)
MKPAKPKSPPRSSTKSADTISTRQSPPPEGGTPNAPHTQFVLLAVTGMSPAVLTETVWGLALERPAVIPGRVVVLTTLAGRQAIERELFRTVEPNPETVWEQLRRAVLGPNAREDSRLILDPPRIISAPNRGAGRTDGLEDIRKREDNSAAADFILEEVRRIVENPDTRLIASLAGGRKTMGALLYAAMTLLGREFDRLTHVLVNEPFEDGRLQPRFFFPPESPIIHRLPGGAGPEARGFSSADARIELADVPFVPLRNRFTDLAELPGSFQALVSRYSRQLRDDSRRKVRVEIQHADRQLMVDGRPLRMRAKALAILHALLALQEHATVKSGQKEAQDTVTEWLQQHPEIGWRSKVTSDDIKHELNHLRAELKKHGATWFPPLRSLRFPPFQFFLPKASRR